MKRTFLICLLVSLSFSVSGCDFIGSIMEMFSGKAGGATAEATSDAVGGETGNALGSVTGSIVKDIVETEGTRLLEDKNESVSDTGTTEKTNVSLKDGI